MTRFGHCPNGCVMVLHVYAPSDNPGVGVVGDQYLACSHGYSVRLQESVREWEADDER